MDATQQTLGYICLHRFPAPRTHHGWRYETVGAVFPEPPFNVIESRRKKFPGGDFILADLHEWVFRKMWVINGKEYESLDGLGLPTFEDEPMPVNLDERTT